MRAVMRVAAAVLLLAAAAIHADSDVSTNAAEIEVSDLQAARLLIAADRLQDAHVFLERAQPQNEEEWIERLFLLGSIEMRLGLAENAESRFETILERHPDLARVQLELAVAYYALGIDDKAKLHFKSTLTENLPFSVESTVKEFLRRIDTRKPWSAFFSFSMLPESNALRRSDVTVVSIGGLPFELDQDSRPSSGVGLLFSGGVSHSTILADNLRGLVAVSGATKMYENTELNDVTIVADLGLSQQFGSKSMSEGLRFGRQWIGGKRFRRIFGVWTQFRWQKSRSVEFELPVSVEYYRYATQSYQDGVEFSVAPRFDFAINDRTLVGV